MKKILISNTDLSASSIILGCMRHVLLPLNECETLIKTAIESGINFFDHADIYGDGECEEIFGKVFNGKREDIILQTKCGIVKATETTNSYFDFSKEHIINSLEKSLKRLKTDYIDIFLLHRPDTLFEPSEVAEAFEKLQKEGKVKYFGVSNQNPLQIDLLQKYLNQKIIINQLQFSIMHTGIIDSGIYFDMNNEKGLMKDSNILEYSRLNNITLQSWSPYQYGFFEGVFIDNDKFPILNEVLKKIAEKHNITTTAVATNWILKHPANMQVIVGTTKKERVKDIALSTEKEITRPEWYEIYQAAGNILP